MLEILKAKKPYDLQAVYASWPDVPLFNGDSMDEPAAWLKAIKAGCQERRVPREYWHRVGMHFMGRRPRERIDQLEAVIRQMMNRQDVWDWKKFEIAVQNLGFSSTSIPKTTPKTVLLPNSKHPTPRKPESWWTTDRPDPSSSEEKAAEHVDGGTPTWPGIACKVLEFLTSDRSKSMSAMSAILMTIGAIPSHPAISAGAGGAFLASSVVQAAGVVAVGVGQALRAIQDGQVIREARAP